MDLNSDAAPAGKPVLLCLFDVEQRPSRRFVRQLAEQHDALRQKGLRSWACKRPSRPPNRSRNGRTPTPCRSPSAASAEKADEAEWPLEVESLPWLILTDKAHRVTAEGLPLEELDAKVEALARSSRAALVYRNRGSDASQ